MHGRRTTRCLRLGTAGALMGVAAVGTAVVISQTGQDSTVVALTPTELAPDASGTAELSERPSGFSIELDIDGLPPAAEGSYYQAWLKNADGELVTIGTFHARDGSDDVILWSGVDPADYPTLTVTLQREGEGAQSSGQVVLTGSLG
ncbi:MAG: anti-sigma factor [Geodermatophilaceae bacterium]